MTDYRTVPVEAVETALRALNAIPQHILTNDLFGVAWPLSADVPESIAVARSHLQAALSASPAPASGDLVEQMASIVRANMPGAPHDLASVNRTARALIAAMQSVETDAPAPPGVGS